MSNGGSSWQLLRSLWLYACATHCDAAIDIDNALNIEVFLPKAFPPEQECMQQIWQSINLPFQLLQRGIFTLHSAAVQTRFGAILFCGRSGIGKSTQANLWKEYENALILNGDRCAVGFVDGAANAFGLPFCGTSGICLNFSLPIAAIISLGQAPENRITRLSGVRALRAIIRRSDARKPCGTLFPRGRVHSHF